MTRDQHEAVDETEDSSVAETPMKGTLDVSLDEGFAAGNTGSVRRRLSAGTLIMGAVLVVSAASLWSMRAIDRAAAGGPVTSKEVEQLFDAALKRGDAGRTIETDASPLLEPTEAANDAKIPLKDLTKNPFVIYRDESATPIDAGPKTPKDPVNTLAQRILAWDAQVDAAAAAIKVQSTMAGKDEQGPVGIANVNGHMMRSGDLFAVDKTDIEFTVSRIERNEVTFRAVSPELKHERLVIVKVNQKW